MNYYREEETQKLTLTETQRNCHRLKGIQEKNPTLQWTLTWVKGTLLIEDEYLSLCIFKGIGCIFKC